MVFSRWFLCAVLMVSVVPFVDVEARRDSAVVVQDEAVSPASRRRGGQASGGYTKHKKLTDADRYEQAKAEWEKNYAKMEKDYKEKYTPNMVKAEVARLKMEFYGQNERQPNADELEAIRIEAEKSAKKHEEIALKAQRDGMKKHLAQYAAYQKDVKDKQEAKVAKMKAAHEALRLPESMQGLYMVMSSGLVFQIDENVHDKAYPYHLYIKQLSGMMREAGRNVNELAGKARYNYRTSSFEYTEKLNYTRESFAIPLNYELVKQGCGDIFGKDDVSFVFQPPKGDDLATDGSVKQWRALSSGLVCPYVSMDYGNCRVKTCLKRMKNDVDVTIVRDPSVAFALGDRFSKEADKTRRSYAEHKKELDGIVTAVNAKAKRGQKPEQRRECPRAWCEDIVINQFIIDQTWGRAPNEKPVW